MKTKDESILEIRGESIGTITESSSSEEKFQNQTLRPILKFQNDLFVKVLKNYFLKYKNSFYSLSLEKRLLYIENATCSLPEKSASDLPLLSSIMAHSSSS